MPGVVQGRPAGSPRAVTRCAASCGTLVAGHGDHWRGSPGV